LDTKFRFDINDLVFVCVYGLECIYLVPSIYIYFFVPTAYHIVPSIYYFVPTTYYESCSLNILFCFNNIIRVLFPQYIVLASVVRLSVRPSLTFHSKTFSSETTRYFFSNMAIISRRTFYNFCWDFFLYCSKNSHDLRILFRLIVKYLNKLWEQDIIYIYILREQNKQTNFAWP
jgi:hypothetical protein